MSNAEKMVMVPRELLERYVSSVEDHNYGFDGDTEIRALLDAPVQQHQGEPVAYRQRFICPDEGPSSWVLTYSNVLYGRPGWEVVPLYTQADPAEVERLRAALLETQGRLEAQTEHNTQRHVELGMESMQVMGESTKLRAKLAEAQALLSKAYKDMEDTIGQSWCISCHQGPEDDGVITHAPSCTFCAMEVALSASAEPSAPKCGSCGASTGQTCNDKGCGHLESGNGEPSAPVIHPINMKTMMQAYEQVDHKAMLHGTSNWCAAMATALRGTLNSEPSAPVEIDERGKS